MAFGMSPFPLQFGSRGGGGASVFTPHFWVDSVNGDDGNDGLTEAAAFQTLGAVETAALARGNGTRIGLVYGSSWAEELAMTIDSCQVRAVGDSTLPLPFIDCSDPAGTWTLVDAATYSYKQTVSIDLPTDGKALVSVFEDGVRMPWVASENVESTETSCYIPAVSGSTIVVTIHPTGDGNPNSNGKSYRISVRSHAISLNGSGNVISGISAARPCHNNGALVVYDGGLIERFKVKDAMAHHVYGGINSRIRKGVCHLHEYSTRGGAFASHSSIVIYENNGVGGRGDVSEVYCYGSPHPLSNAFYGHTAGGDEFDEFMIRGLFTIGHIVPVGGDNVARMIVADSFFRDANFCVGGTTSESCLIDNIVALPGGTYAVNRVFSGTTDDLTVRDSRIVSASFGGYVCYGDSNTSRVENCSLFQASGGLIFTHNVTALDPSIVDSIIKDTYGTYNYPSPSTVEPVESEGNVFSSGASGPRFQVAGTEYTTFAAYRAAYPALDVNSTIADPLLADPENNDWSLGEGSSADTGGRTAGSRSHIDEPDWTTLVSAWEQDYLGFDGHVPPP